MTGTQDFCSSLDNHSSLDTIRMGPPNLTVPDFHSRAVGGVIGRFNGYTSE
jgi:hypothetical protein